MTIARPASSKPSSVLILGESGTAKTNYAAQLYGRLVKESGSLKLREASADLTPFSAALERLQSGLEAQHTVSGMFAQVSLKLLGPAGEELDLVWPDYAGEQVKDMIEHRKITPEWRKRLSHSQCWLLFIRPTLLRDPQDIFNRPIESLLRQPAKDGARGSVIWSDQARLIELLQLLLFAHGTSALHRARRPPLGILLSCWDELQAPEGTRPLDVLRERAPLLSDFIESRWHPEGRFVLGIAPLGKTLKKDDPDVGFVDQGPEQQGWVVSAEGKHTPDLTLPLMELIRRM